MLERSPVQERIPSLPEVQHVRGPNHAGLFALRRPIRVWATPRRAVAAMFLLNGALFGVWASRIPSIVERFDLAPSKLGLALLCMAAGGIASFPVTGRLSDRYGASLLTRRVALLYLVSLCLVGFAPTALAFAASLILFGAMQGALDVAMNAWGAEAEKHLGRPIMSSLHAMFSLGAGLGAASGYLAVRFGLDVGLHFSLACVVLGGICFTAASNSWSSPIAANNSSGKLMIPRRGLALVGLVALCATLGEGAMADWSAMLLFTVTQVSEAQSALGYAAFSAAMVVMRLVGDRIVDRWGPVWSARLSGTLAASGAITAILGQNMILVLAGFVLMGVGYANIAPLAFSRAGSDPDVPPGTAIAGVAILGYGGLLIGPPLIGWIAGASSLRFAFGLLAGLSVLICLLGGVLETPYRRCDPGRRC